MSIRYQEAETDTALDALILAERASLFWEKFDQLSANCQKLMRMSFEERPAEEIQQAMGYGNPGTARVKKTNCKKKLAELVMADERYKELTDG